jgi:hypothetical protein
MAAASCFHPPGDHSRYFSNSIFTFLQRALKIKKPAMMRVWWVVASCLKIIFLLSTLLSPNHHTHLGLVTKETLRALVIARTQRHTMTK